MGCTVTAPAMAYGQAAREVVPFGKHRGKTIDEVGTTDDGLRYLDWLRGELDLEHERTGKQDLRPPARERLRRAVVAYLDDATIASELRRVLAERRSR